MSLRYPQEIGSDQQDYITFTPMEYRSNARGGSAPAASGGGGAITLYMPNSTPVVGNAQTWGELGFQGPIGELRRDIHRMVHHGIMGLGGQGTPSGYMQDVAKQLNTQKHVSQAGNIGRQALMNAVQGISAASPNQMLALQSGRVFNPNLELLYQNPTFRSFSFNFDFVPRNQSDTNSMNQIIKKFKTESAPKDLNNGMFEVPKVWQVRYMSGSGDNQFMNKFKPAACLSVSVQANQTSDMHLTTSNGAPISTTLNLMFKEVEIVLRKDHEGAPQGY